VGPILVFGHRNPDNDSICSAVAYAHLKNLTDPARVYVPVRLGSVPAETAWAFDRFGVELPEMIGHVRTRVTDVMTTDVVSVAPTDTLLSVGRVLAEHGVRALPVLDGDQVKGLVTMQALATRYVDDLSVSGFVGRPVTVGSLAATLDAEVLTGDVAKVLEGNVLIGAMEPSTMVSYIKPGDTLIVGDRRRTQPMAIEAGVACLVITGGTRPGAEVFEAAEKAGAAVLLTDKDSYGAARLMNLSHPVRDMMETDALMLEPETLLSEAAEDLFASPYREAIVLEADGTLAGLLTRTNVARAGKREVILVDHNEVAQSADGVDEAAVVEIVDHHRIGDIETSGPIRFLNLPVGASATIVTLEFRRHEIDPSPEIAGLLLAAILTDTVMLKSPTTTDIDREMVDYLSSEVDLDPVEFGMEMFRSRTLGQAFSADKVVKADMKEYRVGESRVVISQVETVDLDDVLSHRDELLRYMETLSSDRGYDVALLMVTDVVREGSELLVVGKRRVAERAFGVSFESGSAWFDGMLSRKKQVAPRLVENAG
jgi:manganese-dependent inorganic pyrophosphatase